ncbi:hypoxia-inducible factor 1-alpha-like isoform X2 [Atheta coriaria]|uniref:hypoxia-inducible factor 1-alpha-like isoform X2 n=1 Tax=Dalotia coriaria TaxID=877792 RepID=UPI0031F3CE5D
MNCVNPVQQGYAPIQIMGRNNQMVANNLNPNQVPANPHHSQPSLNNQYGYYASANSQNGALNMPIIQPLQHGACSNFTPRFDIPCNTYQNWTYDQCYGYYTADGCYTSCQYTDVIDMEDFMNNEKRKEKSRDAARCRRSRETEIFSDLSAALPLTQEQISQLDKASIMRLAISYLKVRDMIKLVPEICTEEAESKCLDIKHSENTTESVFLKTIDGFVFVLSTDGDFVYVSENICDYLGINQIDLLGQNIYDYSHPCDHDEIKEMISIKNKDQFDSEDTKSFFLRLKCTLTAKGRSVNLKSASYKVIHCTGHMMHTTDDTQALESNSNLQHCLVAIGQPIPHPSNIEAPLPHQTFFTKHSLDMKFTYADEKMLEFLGFESDDLIGKSVYEYHHAMDMNVISTAYKSLFSKGQCETNRYRFLAKTGGYCWVLTQATLLYDKVQKPESVVCVNFIISEVECAGEIYAAFQLESSSKIQVSASARAQTTPPLLSPLEITTDAEEEIDIKLPLVGGLEDNFVPLTITPPASVPEHIVEEDDNSRQGLTEHKFEVHGPKTATSKIFAPRTEEMNKGFLTFSDEEPGLTLLKDEPDDLTHLAPVAGDVVSLETHPFLTDMLDDFLLKDGGFCPLLTEEPQDPFIAYRDSCDPSPQLLSPNILKTSDCSLPSLNSPTDSLSEEDQMTTFMTFPMEEDPELVMKAPYISMTIGDDLPLLNSEDLMWSEGVHGVQTQYSNRKGYAGNGVANPSGITPGSTSSLAELLSASVSKHTKEDILDRIDPYSNKSVHSLSGVKRGATPYDISPKRIKSEPKDMMSSELLQQLISNNTHNAAARRVKNKSNWLLDTGGKKAACVSQPSDSVLMNLLDTDQSMPLSPAQRTLNLSDQESFLLTTRTMQPPSQQIQLQNAMLQQQLLQLQQKQFLLEQQQILDQRQPHARKSSISLLDPEALGISSLLDLTQQDYEVNAPVCNNLLQGDDLLFALNNDGVLSDGVI